MFADAIELVGGYTRPVFTIMRAYGSKDVLTAAGTLFFVNDRAAAITTKHIALMLKNADEANRKYFEFKRESALISPDRDREAALRELELKYNYLPDTVVQVRNSFVDCVDKFTGFKVNIHPKYDLATVEFTGFEKILYKGHATLKKNTKTIRQGDYLCRLGYSFPEFNNYEYNEATDELRWTKAGVHTSPRFPMDGMVTRFLADKEGLNGIELSTPGLIGQSGGPLFDTMGNVCGIQSATRHIHMGFDMVNTEVRVKGVKQNVSNYPFLHLGQCVHVDVIKAFLKEKEIPFTEEVETGFTVRNLKN